MSKAKKSSTHKGLEVILFETKKQWLNWIKRNHGQTEGIWIKFAKKGSGFSSITYEQAREGAIVYGWIDGLLNSLSDDFYLRKFTPRRPKSSWSKINREIAEQLILENRIAPTGLAEVEAAKSDGRWEAAYDGQTLMEVPDDLTKLFRQNPNAKRFFDQLNRADRYSFLYRIQTARRPQTRQKHLNKTIEMLNNGEVYHRTKSAPVKKKAVMKKTVKKKTS